MEDNEVTYRLETVDKDGGITGMNSKDLKRLTGLLLEMLESETNPFLSFTVYRIERNDDADESYWRTIMAGWKDVNNL